MISGRPIVVAHVLIGRHIGGLERVVIGLIKGADPERYRSILCFLEEEGDWADEVRTICQKIVAFRKNPGLSYGLPVRLALLLRSGHVDVVHGHDFSGYLYGSLAGRLARCRGIIYTVHGPHVFAKKRHRFLQRLPLAHQIVAVSDHIRNEALSRLRVDPARIVTVPNGVNVGLPAGLRPRPPRELTETVRPLIGCVGRLSLEKDHETLLTAFMSLLVSAPEAKLLIVGDGPLRDELETRVAGLGLANSVTFTGSRRDISEILAGLDVFALASREEGLPLALLEAMAAGVPVVATRVGGVPPVVAHEKTGLLVPAGDPHALAAAMARLLSDRHEADRMGRAGAQLVKDQYGLDRMIEAYDVLYSRFAPGGSAAADQRARSAEHAP